MAVDEIPSKTRKRGRVSPQRIIEAPKRPSRREESGPVWPLSPGSSRRPASLATVTRHGFFSARRPPDPAAHTLARRPRFWGGQGLRPECVQQRLKNHVEIGGESPVAITEEQPVCRVGDVPVERFRIEVIGQVETADGQANRVFRIHLEVFGKS